MQGGGYLLQRLTQDGIPINRRLSCTHPLEPTYILSSDAISTRKRYCPDECGRLFVRYLSKPSSVSRRPETSSLTPRARRNSRTDQCRGEEGGEHTCIAFNSPANPPTLSSSSGCIATPAGGLPPPRPPPPLVQCAAQSLSGASGKVVWKTGLSFRSCVNSTTTCDCVTAAHKRDLGSDRSGLLVTVLLSCCILLRCQCLLISFVSSNLGVMAFTTVLL
jgi:hypothetical protein